MPAAATATEVPFSYDATKVTLGSHEFPMSYGTILMVALEQIVIPLTSST